MTMRLLITAGRGVGREFVFAQPVVRIGRGPDNDLVLSDTGVSRSHCELVQDGDVITLRDTESASGTLVNGALATEAHLVDGDSLQVGSVVFRVHTQQAHEATVSQVPEGVGVTFPEEPTPLSPVGFAPGSIEAPPTRRSTAAGRRWGGPWAWVASGAVMLVALAASAWIALTPSRKDRSLETFRLTAQVASLSFGAGNVDVQTPDRVSFAFQWGGGRATLRFAAAGLDAEDELEIVVNGRGVGYAPPTSRGWVSGLEVVLPRRVLRPGENVLTFDNKMIPGSSPDERWGIGQVVVAEEQLPAPNETEAKRLLGLGKAAFEARAVAPQNLGRAVQYLSQARDNIEALEPPGALLAEIEPLLAKARAELVSVHDGYVFAAEQALRFGDRARAVQSLRDLLRYFPDPADARHQRAKDRLNELTRGDALQ